MSPSTPSLLAVLLAAGTVSAQTATLDTLTPIGVFAQQGNRSDYQVIAKNQSIAAGNGVSIAANLNNSHSTTLISWQQRGTTISVDLSQQGGVTVGRTEPAATAGTSASPSTPYAPGPHAVLLRIRANPGTLGLLDLSAIGGLNTPARGVQGSLVIDIDDNGSPELDAPVIGFAANSLPVKIPASGVLTVKMQMDVQVTQNAPGGYLYKSGLSLVFTTAPFCVVRNYGTGCGPTLTGTLTQQGRNNVLNLSYAGGTVNSSGLLILGTQKVDVTIPGVQCNLLNNALIVTTFRTRAGSMSWQFPFSQLLDIDVKIQAADLGGRRPSATPGLHVICKQ